MGTPLARATSAGLFDLAKNDPKRITRGGIANVGPPELIASGLIRKVAKHGLRILGDGKLERALHVTAHYFTESARDKIVKAGGSAEVIVP